MGAKVKLILLPLSLVFLVLKQLSRYLFKVGIWKSIEFDKSIIVMSTFMKKPAPMGLLVLIQKALAKNGMNHALLLDEKQLKHSKLKVSNTEDFQYLKTIENHLGFYHSSYLPLGISELISNDAALSGIILGQGKYVGIVRPKIRILVIDFKAPFFRSYTYPMGDVIELKTNIGLANFIIVYNAPAGAEVSEVKAIVKNEIKKDIETIVLFENEMLDDGIYLSYNQPDQFINIQDHDTFEKSLIKIFEQDQ